MQMRDFPQDTQTAPLLIESDSYDEAGLVWDFLVLPQVDFVHAGWTLLGTGFSRVSHHYPVFAATYAQAAFHMRLQRDPRYYYMRYVLNIMLLVALSLLGAILSPLETSRIILSVTLFLGVVSWMFVLVVDAPKSDQPTRMDHFFIASFVVLLLQALYFTLRNHNYDATLAPLPFWKGWLEASAARGGEAAKEGGGGSQVRRRRGRVARSRSVVALVEQPPPSSSREEGGDPPPGAPPNHPPNPALVPDAPGGGGAGVAAGGGGRSSSGGEAGAAGGEVWTARSGTREQQEAEFVRERVRESLAVNSALVVAYGVWVACIFLLP